MVMFSYKQWYQRQQEVSFPHDFSYLNGHITFDSDALKDQKIFIIKSTIDHNPDFSLSSIDFQTDLVYRYIYELNA